MPALRVPISKLNGSDKKFPMPVEDNGPGIGKAQVPNVFGRRLYGSKFHRLRQSRGQQGIGISAAGMYGPLTTGHPVRVKSKPGKRAPSSYFQITIATPTTPPAGVQQGSGWGDTAHGTEGSVALDGA